MPRGGTTGGSTTAVAKSSSRDPSASAPQPPPCRALARRSLCSNRRLEGSECARWKARARPCGHQPETPPKRPPCPTAWARAPLSLQRRCRRLCPPTRPSSANPRIGGGSMGPKGEAGVATQLQSCDARLVRGARREGLLQSDGVESVGTHIGQFSRKCGGGRYKFHVINRSRGRARQTR